LTTSFIAVPEPAPPRRKIPFRDRLEYWLSSAKQVSVATHKQRQSASLGGGGAARDGDVQQLDTGTGAKAVQFARGVRGDRAHLKRDGSWSCSRKNSFRSGIHAANRVIVGQARENHINRTRQFLNARRNDATLCSDGFRFNGIPVVYR
jgi:hypothetical protein